MDERTGGVYRSISQLVRQALSCIDGESTRREDDDGGQGLTRTMSRFGHALRLDSDDATADDRSSLLSTRLCSPLQIWTLEISQSMGCRLQLFSYPFGLEIKIWRAHEFWGRGELYRFLGCAELLSL